MMQDNRQVSAVCAHCGKASEVAFPALVNVKDHPELKEEVQSGRIFVWRCPSCGTPGLLRAPLLYHDPDARLMVWLSDGKPETEERMREALASGDGLEDYTLRVADGPGDLMEKVKIADAGLDDIAIELCKYVTCQELGREVDLRFFRMEGPDNDLTLTYPEKGEMQMIQIGFNVYEDSAAIVRRNPAMKEKATGLVRVDRRWLAQFLG